MKNLLIGLFFILFTLNAGAKSPDSKRSEGGEVHSPIKIRLAGEPPMEPAQEMVSHPCKAEPWLCDPVEKFEVLSRAFGGQSEELRGYRIALQAVREWGEKQRRMLIQSVTNQVEQQRVKSELYFIENLDQSFISVSDVGVYVNAISAADDQGLGRVIKTDEQGRVICSGEKP